MNKKIKIEIAVGIILLVALIIGGVAYFGDKKMAVKENGFLIKNEPKTCIQEAKICLDGSMVYRRGVNCEFDQCPDEKDYVDCKDKNKPFIIRKEDSFWHEDLYIKNNKLGSVRAYLKEVKKIIYLSTSNELRVISTVCPYGDEKILDYNEIGVDFESLSNLGAESIYYKNLYFWGSFGDGPGSYYSLFIFSPQEKKYLFVHSSQKIDYSGKTIAFGSESKDVYKNNEFCSLPTYYYGEPNNYLNELDLYVNLFPKKIPCLNGMNLEGGKIVGYIDLEKNRYIKK